MRNEAACGRRRTRSAGAERPPPEREQPRHYVYRMDHDTGFAPRIRSGYCLLCGCKSTTVERWAQRGSWIVGIGGLRTGRPDHLIYAMKVGATPRLEEFARENPQLAAYLLERGMPHEVPVLVSRHFFYFGRNAIRLSSHLRKLRIDRHGAWRISAGDIALLEEFLQPFGPGKHGEPNNAGPLQ